MADVLEAAASGSLSTSTSILSTSTLSAVPTTISALAHPTPLSTSWLWSIVYILSSTAYLLRLLTFHLLAFTTYTLPTSTFALFSMTLTFTLNFTTLFLILTLFASAITWIVRYRYLNIYAQLPPEPQRQAPEIDLPPDSAEGDTKPGLNNYLDEFLSAIKIFGYLERPVFHELTRHMQTRKLIAGETFLLEEEKGFCLVVDGLVQIFTKASKEDRSYDFRPTGLEGYGEDAENEEGHGYQLLTEVKNGAPMSSLFTILSLFTEEVTLRRADSDDGDWGRMSNASMKPPNGETPERGLSPEHSERVTPDEQKHAPLHPLNTHVPPFSLADDVHGDAPEGRSYTPVEPRPQRPKLKKMHSVHPDIVARASVDTTIAVIPAAAFRRLTRVYPKASAHIVQVILTRFQRVTFLTAYSYLGLTSEVLRTEKLMSYYTTYALPNELRGAALDRLKEKFAQERERSKPDEDETKGIALHNPHLMKRRRRSSATLRKEVALHARIAAAKRTPTTPIDTPAESPFSRRPYPGDLETSTPLKIHQPNPFGQGWTTSQPAGLNIPTIPNPNLKHREFGKIPETAPQNEDTAFREAVLDCMFKALGLNHKGMERRLGLESGDQSPRLLSYDAKRQKAVFSNAFGFIDPYEGSHDETESQASTGTSFAGLSSIVEDLKDDVEIVFFPQGAVLVEQGDRCPGLYYVLDGFLEATIPVDEKAQDKNVLGTNDGMVDPNDLPPLTRTTTNSSALGSGAGSSKKRKTTTKSLYMVKPGGVAGYMGSISAYRSFIDVRAKTDVYVGFIPRSSLERIVEKYPVVLLTMAKRLTSLLPRLILHIDFALEWLQVSAGQVIYHQNDESDAIYIVLNGRMRAITEDKSGGMKVVGEYGQGESVGELEVLTESERPATLHAIRDTEIAKFPKTLFNSLALEHPGITIQISKIIASRMRSLMDSPVQELSLSPAARQIRPTVNPRTVCILPITSGVPVTEFSQRLSSALQQTSVPGGVVLLNQAAILNHLGRHAFNRMGKLKLSGYLADLEEKYGMVLYVCDTNVNAPWTQTCISQADCILLVGLAEAPPTIGEYEKFLLGMKTTARKDLVLLHTERYCSAGLTRRWLKSRVWITGGHHHIQMAFRTAPEPPHVPGSRLGIAIKQRVQELQAEITKYTSRRVVQTPMYSSETPLKSDFHRLARRLCGKAIGLVLGGGGARGIAHVGVIRALEDAGIPVDIVGGTSIGAFVGALYARDADVVSVYGRAKKFAGRMASVWRFVLDLTYPSVSYTTGHEFNRGIFKTFRESQIEDFWLEFYCNTTNISHSRQEIHTSGYAWRYIRASMSLAGLLPPLCDEGSMLLDGGYVDNLTVAHMRSLGADLIFAVDVGSIDDTTPQSFGDSLSGFWAWANRWNFLSRHPNPPTLAEIQARLAYVSSVDALEKAKNTPGVLYMRPPIDAYGTLDFGRFDEICEVGYRFGKEFVGEVKEKGGLEGLVGTGRERREMRRTRASRRASI